MSVLFSGLSGSLVLCSGAADIVELGDPVPIR